MIASLKVAAKPAFRHSARKSSARLASLAVELAEDHAHEGADLRDHAGRGDRGRDLRHAAHHGVSPEDRDQPLMGIDAVLQRDHGGAGADQRLDALARAFDVPQLDAEQHDIDLADTRGIVGGLGRHQMGVAERAGDLQPGALHGGEMRAARDEGDVGARLRQRRAESPTDPAGADNRNTHEFSPSSLTGGAFNTFRPIPTTRKPICFSVTARHSRPKDGVASASL